ncbi:MAG: phosphoethanolamine transferase CptA [Proteobacteria bacterium]|nr:phosphoethanolamine transferase CptA [Cystobacterineae bacterium]MCL2259050.1 phosphoethanolamine transferase CptA [Cystobacterineae bacterium]MCL2314608.1 phosphoethanolamine transferase CptA [Pseudomonadota bacterium]
MDWVGLGWLYLFFWYFSDVTQALEFLSQYVVFPLLAGIAAYTVVAYLLWKRLRPVHLARPYALGLASAVLVLNFGTPYIGCLSNKPAFSLTFSGESAAIGFDAMSTHNLTWCHGIT